MMLNRWFKNILLLGLLVWGLLLPLAGFGQLEGKYISEPSNAVCEFDFFKDGGFHVTTFGGSGKRLGEGNWKMSEDTLVMDFIAYQDSPYKDCSHIDVEYLAPSADPDSFSVCVSVAECHSQTSLPFAIAIIYFFEEGKLVPVDTFETDMTATACGKIPVGIDSFVVLANAPEYVATDILVKADSGKDVTLAFHLFLDGFYYIDPETSWKYLLLKQDKKSIECRYIYEDGELGEPRRFVKIKPSWSRKKVLKKAKRFYDLKQ